MTLFRLFNPSLPAAHTERCDALPGELRDYVAECQQEYLRQSAHRPFSSNSALVAGFSLASGTGGGITLRGMETARLEDIWLGLTLTAFSAGAAAYYGIMGIAAHHERREQAHTEFAENMQATGLEAAPYLPEPTKPPRQAARLRR